ncbi:MAG: DUF4115 domain-containing protein [Mariprofundaceae bacterium]|nr:DUF4115 domain-containing protein [Mariprofundaceae bacterium]
MSAQKNTDDKQTEQETPLSDVEQRDQARIRLGERLSTARESKEISLNEASERLRIHKTYLQGLESGDWSALPEEVYAMGFLRQYAALLGVNVSKDIEALKPCEYKLTKPFTMPDPPIAMNRGWAIAAAACFLLLLVLFNVVDEEKEEFPFLQDLQNNIAELSLSELNPSESNSSEQDASPEANSPVLIEPAVSPKPATVRSDNIEAGPSTSESQNPQVTKTTAISSAESPVASPVKLPKQSERSTSGHQYRLTAIDQDVWLQLHAPNGDLLKEALLRSGQRMEVYSGEDFLLLTSGNPLVLRIEIDGRRVVGVGTLGEKHKVLRDFRLTPPASDTGNEP